MTVETSAKGLPRRMPQETRKPCIVTIGVSMTPCKHDWIRYVLDDSAARHAQQDGLDKHGRLYRDVPMLPKQVFAYAATIGSTFATRGVAVGLRRACSHTHGTSLHEAS